MECPSCHADNPAGTDRCGRCGTDLLACTTCGAPMEPGQRFCRRCGAPAGTASAAGQTAPPDAGTGPAAPSPPRSRTVPLTRPAPLPPSFAAESPAAPPPPPLAPPSPPRALRPRPDAHGPLDRITAFFRPRPAVPAPPVPVGSLLIHGPRGERREWPLTGAQEIIIGREPPADLILEDAGISRRHARLTRVDGRLELADLGSRNGTLLNGRTLRGRHLLEPGDEVMIGPYRLLARPPDAGGTIFVRPRARVRAGPLLIGVGAGAAVAVVVAVLAMGIVRSRAGNRAAAPVAATTTPPVTTVVVQSETQQIAEAVKKVRPSVVRIRTRTADGDGVGTGIVVDDRLILTNEHVVRGDPMPTITLVDGRTVRGQVLGVDSTVDLAVVRVDVPNLVPAAWGDSDTLQLGERLIAMGYALGLSGEPTVTSGIFSGRRDLRGQSYVQTDTALNSGNSGGPLFNLKGEVIGVNVLVLGRTAELQAQGINLAVPSTIAKQYIAVLRNQPPQRTTTATPAPTTTGATAPVRPTLPPTATPTPTATTAGGRRARRRYG
jgi:putative serine protease PepD